MKTFRKLISSAFAGLIILSGFRASIPTFATTIEFNAVNNLEKEAEKLYEKINDFLDKNKDCSPEEFEEICKEYMMQKIETQNLLNKNEFDKKFPNSLLLYRGLSSKKFADDLKSGNVYVAPNTRNVRGMGVYTTTSLEIAQTFSDKNDPSTIVQMILPNQGVKILENEHLERLKEIIRANHKEEFGEFSAENKNLFIFDSLSEYLEKYTNQVLEKIKNENIQDENLQQQLLDDTLRSIEKDSLYQSLKTTRKKYFKTNKAAIFYNSGLLTKLLGFDVLHSKDFLNEVTKFKKDEYLVVNTKLLGILI